MECVYRMHGKYYRESKQSDEVCGPKEKKEVEAEVKDEMSKSGGGTFTARSH